MLPSLRQYTHNTEELLVQPRVLLNPIRGSDGLVFPAFHAGLYKLNPFRIYGNLGTNPEGIQFE
jgi:hypothetical protein